MINALPNKVNIRFGILSLGNDVILVFTPFEPIYDIQELLKEDIGNKYGKFILLIGYSYNYLGYLSNKDVLNYESLSTIVYFNDIYNALIKFTKEILFN